MIDPSVTKPSIPIAAVQRAWDDAQPFLDAQAVRGASFEWLATRKFITDFDSNFPSHVSAAAASMGFLSQRPVYVGLNEREAGVLRIEELFCRFVEREYGHAGRACADAIRGVPSAVASVPRFDLLESGPLPGWMRALAWTAIATDRREIGVASPSDVPDELFYISPFRWLLATKNELIDRGVPADRVDQLRFIHTGHERNMQARLARTVGLWGGILSAKAIAHATGTPLGAIQSYKKKNERERANGRRPLKTSDASRTRSQAGLAFLVGHRYRDEDATAVCTELGILRIEHKLYAALWDQVVQRMDEPPDDERSLLSEAHEVLKDGCLRIALPPEYWGEMTESRPANTLSFEVLDSHTTEDTVPSSEDMTCIACRTAISVEIEGEALCRKCWRGFNVR